MEGCPVSTATVETTAEKVCVKCGGPKPLTEYHLNRESPDGHSGCCKVCHIARVLVYATTPIGRVVNARARVGPKLRAARAKVERYAAEIAELDAEYWRLKDGAERA